MTLASALCVTTENDACVTGCGKPLLGWCRVNMEKLITAIILGKRKDGLLVYSVREGATGI